MSEGGDPASVVNAAENFFGAGTNARNKARPAAREPCVERFRDARDVSRFDQRPGDPGASDSTTRIRKAWSKNGLAIQVNALSLEADEHLPDAFHPMPSLGAQKGIQGIGLQIEKIGEHVHVAVARDRRDFDAGNKSDAMPLACGGCLRASSTYRGRSSASVVTPARAARATSSSASTFRQEAVEWV